LSLKNDPISFFAHLIDAVPVNRTRECFIGGKRFLLKRRRWGRGAVIVLGNAFLKLSHSRISMFPRSKAWQQWEIHSYQLLYDRTCLPILNDVIRVEPLPGRSLRDYLDDGRLSAVMMRAAGAEFKRAHALLSPELDGLWSHGDPHLNNVLYDKVSGCAYLIDFETRHETQLSAVERHADDLLVLLLDLIGRDRSMDWFALSRAFLDAYDDAAVLQALSARLTVPRGLELALWKTRTNHLETDVLRERLELLHQLIENVT
jgi:hypothetical protein